jgi:hypothetical protein
MEYLLERQKESIRNANSESDLNPTKKETGTNMRVTDAFTKCGLQNLSRILSARIHDIAEVLLQEKKVSSEAADYIFEKKRSL